MSNRINRNYIQAYSKLELLAKQVVEGFITGHHKSPFHGFSVEFAEHRLYNPGESTRHIDWKLYAKTEKYFIKRYEEETNLRCHIVIDNSASMHFPFDKKPSISNPNKSTFSVYAAAAIIEILKQQRDAFGLSVFSDKIDYSSTIKNNSAHQKMIYNELEKLLENKKPEVNTNSSIAESLHQFAEMTHKRSLIVIFSDMFESNEDEEAIFNALQHLKHFKHEVILFQVVQTKLEVDFDYQNRPYKFIDSETGEILKLNPKDIKSKYIEQIKEYNNNIKLKCGQYNIDFVEVDIEKGFDAILLPYILKRKKMM
ncbi:MAG: DUF58 domain-containing protein [Bacteroidetes bacterium]|nr:MAG: DUF58 domain-containing protein [Bacteroidota bacterium]